jgi:hypothetical protein
VEEVIGLYLDQCSPNAHNGTVYGKIYFHALDGRGYFILKRGIMENLCPTSRRIKISMVLDNDIIANIGDRVEISGGRFGTGTIKYVGETDFSKGEEIIGLEMVKKTKNANYEIGRYFKSESGKGYFTRKNSIINFCCTRF